MEWIIIDPEGFTGAGAVAAGWAGPSEPPPPNGYSHTDIPTAEMHAYIHTPRTWTHRGTDVQVDTHRPDPSPSEQGPWGWCGRQMRGVVQGTAGALAVILMVCMLPPPNAPSPLCDQAQIFYWALPLAPVCQRRPTSRWSRGWYITGRRVLTLTALLSPSLLI